MNIKKIVDLNSILSKNVLTDILDWPVCNVLLADGGDALILLQWLPELEN